MARILVVDDEPRYTRVIQTSLETGGYQVLLAVDGSQAIRMAEQERPDLILMDLRLPGVDGYEASRQIRASFNIPIIMLTAVAEVENKVKGLEIGAEDYLTKPFSPQELLARIRAVLRRLQSSKAQEWVFEAGGLRVDFQKQTVTVLGRAVALTPKEYCLLCELISQPGTPIPPEELLLKIWGPGYEQEHRLVWQTVHRLRAKIEPETRKPRYIHTNSGAGYSFLLPEIL